MKSFGGIHAYKPPRLVIKVEDLRTRWIEMESDDGRLGIQRRAEMFEDLQKAGFATMNEQDLAAFNALPETFTVWRGGSPGRAIRYSWTTEFDVAVQFAEHKGGLAGEPRGDCRGWTGTVQKADIVAFFVGGIHHDEQEVIIHPDKVTNITFKDWTYDWMDYKEEHPDSYAEFRKEMEPDWDGHDEDGEFHQDVVDFEEEENWDE